MTIRIPQNTQNYLAVMLENKIQANRGESLFANIEGYRQKYIQEVTTAPVKEKTDEEKAKEKKKQLEASLAGGFGSGGPTPKTLKPGKYRDASLQNVRDITFGDTDAEGLVGAGIAYGAGTLGGWLGGMLGARTIDAMNQRSKAFTGVLGKAAESAGLSKAAVLTNIGGQIEDLTRKSAVDAQLANIGRAQIGLDVQGVGSPWVPFVMPGAKKTKLPEYEGGSQEQRDFSALNKAIQRQTILNKAKKLGII